MSGIVFHCKKPKCLVLVWKKRLQSSHIKSAHFPPTQLPSSVASLSVLCLQEEEKTGLSKSIRRMPVISVTSCLLSITLVLLWEISLHSLPNQSDLQDTNSWCVSVHSIIFHTRSFQCKWEKGETTALPLPSLWLQAWCSSAPLASEVYSSKDPKVGVTPCTVTNQYNIPNGFSLHMQQLMLLIWWLSASWGFVTKVVMLLCGQHKQQQC